MTITSPMNDGAVATRNGAGADTRTSLTAPGAGMAPGMAPGMTAGMPGMTQGMPTGMAAGGIQPAVVVSGVATQYWDEAIALPTGSPNQLWLFVDGGWRYLTSPSTATRDLVQRAFLGTASSVRVWYDGGKVVGLVITGS
jgi:hypothetical protein